MFSKPQIGIFALSVLSVQVFERVVGHPVQPEALPQFNNRVVVRVTARAAPTPTCSVCTAAVTVTVSGTATFTADPRAITVSVGPFVTIGGSANTSSTPSSTTISGAAASPTESSSSSSSIGNFGSCSTPAIDFGAGFDGQKATSFQPHNKTSFDCPPAPNISTISQFICDTLANSCGADATAQATCARAQTAAAAAPLQEGIDADIFNGFFGIVTDFAATPALGGGGNVFTSSTTTSTTFTSVTTDAATPTVQTTAPSPTTAVAAPTTTNAAKTTTAILSTVTATASTGASNNLQLFTGNLGGIVAPAVVASGSQFQVQGNSIFSTKTDAIVRSCNVQHNDCANAANASGNKGDLTVAACNTQQDACDNAANSA